MRTTLTLPVKAKTLAQQKTDFTDEGSPAPGNVGLTTPATTGAAVRKVGQAIGAMRKARKGAAGTR